MPGIGLPEVIIVLIIALVVLGPKRLPEAGRAVGRGMREFKESLTGDHKDDQDESHKQLVAVEATPAVPVSPAVVSVKHGEG